jgi:hypothetical protein
VVEAVEVVVGVGRAVGGPEVPQAWVTAVVVVTVVVIIVVGGPWWVWVI